MTNNFLLVISILVLSACGSGTDNKEGDTTGDSAAVNKSAVDKPTVEQTAKEAYEYGLPLVLMDLSRRQMMDPESPMLYAPNTFRHFSSFPDAKFRSVVRPNADTYYSIAWLDLTKEPVVLSVPDTRGRYYMLPMMDAYSNVFASPGTRTTGNGKNVFLVSGPDWNETVPAGMKQIKAPDNTVWIIGRTQVNSKSDGEKVVVPLQNQFKLSPLSAYGKSWTPPAAAPDSAVPKGDPNSIVKNMPAEEFFNYVNRMLAKNPPPAEDKQVMDRFAELGVGAGKKFDLARLSAADQSTVRDVPKAVFADLDKQLTSSLSLVNGWNIGRDVIGTYGTNYAARASVSFFGLGANLREDAIYPSCNVDGDGNPLNGSNKYVIHFNKGETPPANAFWSLTMYDPEGYFIDNSINRYAIGDRSNLNKNADGSVDIYIQQSSPGKDKENNWLPAPAGSFNLLMRVYWPKEEMLNKTWQVPPVKKSS